MNKNKIKIAIVGVGNCASSLIQGINFYKRIGDTDVVPGLLHPTIDKYRPKDIEVVAAFDIDKRKVGKDVVKAIFQKPNNTKIFCNDIKSSGVIVSRGPTLDGYPRHFDGYSDEMRPIESVAAPVDVIKILKKVKPDILINYLPVGSERATDFYVNCCLKAGVSLINAIPVFICSDKKYIKKFAERGLVCAGDDIKSQVGATIIHRTLTNLFEKRGIKLTKTYQLNVGGNTDFLNMLEQSRLVNKRTSKTEAVQSALAEPLPKKDIHVGPSDFIEWLADNKVCYIRMDGLGFGDTPLTLDVKLSVEDSPNSAGVMIDAIRVCKLALDRGARGYLDELSSFAFKHPLRQRTDGEAIKKLDDFIRSSL